jgi:hypothetical protein
VRSVYGVEPDRALDGRLAVAFLAAARTDAWRLPAYGDPTGS